MVLQIVSLFFLLQFKHLLADWLFQPAYIHRNKGTFGHPGGLLHAGLHALMTAQILLAFTTSMLVLYIAAAEFVAHYLIDWAKMNLNKWWGLVPIPAPPYEWPRSEGFWMLLGFDQFLHQVCYVLIVRYVFQ